MEAMMKTIEILELLDLNANLFIKTKCKITLK